MGVRRPANAQRIWSWTAVLTGTLLGSACSSGPSGVDAPTVAAISLAPSDSTLWVGQALQLRISIRDNKGLPLTPSTLTWSSSNAGVATVNSGQVTGVTAGQVTITARSGTVSGSAAVSVRVRPVGVVSVQLNLPVSRFEVADTTSFAATPLDADTQPLTGRTITWTSSDPDIVSVLPTGFFTGVSPGTATVTATVDGITAQAPITVVPQSGQAVPWPHEPAGAVKVSERAFASLEETGWHDTQTGPNFGIVTDSGAPKSAMGVGQMRFPAGFSSVGTAPGVAETNFNTNAMTVYCSFWVKFSSNWVGHSSGVNKIVHFWIGGSNNVIAEAYGSGTEPLRPMVMFQGIANMGGAAAFAPNLVPTMKVPRGKWHRWEIVLKTNSAGAADGTVEWWIDGVRVGTYDKIQIKPGLAKWDGMMWNPTWGGVGGPTVPVEQIMWMDHIYASAR